MKRNIVFLVIISLLFLAVPIVTAAENDPDALFSSGVDAFNAGKYDEAVSIWERTLPLYKANGDIEHEAMVKNNLGLVHFYMREYQKAIDYFTSALAIDRKRGISKDIATDLQNLGMAYYQMGSYQEALAAFRESAETFGSVSDPEGEAKNLYYIGMTDYALGNYVEAGRFYSAAADQHRSLRDRAGYALDITGLGDVYAALDRFDKAMENYTEVLKVREVLGEKVPYVRAEIKIAKALENKGRYDEGIEYLNRAQKDAKDAKSEPLLGDIAAARGDILNSSGDWEGALAAYEEAISLMKKGDDLAGVGLVLTDKGILLGELLRFSDAKKSFEDARLIYQVTKDTKNEAKVVVNLGNLMNTEGNLDAALTYYGEAQKLLGTETSRVVSGVNLLGIGEVYLWQKEYKKARTAFTDAGKLVNDERDKRYEAKIDAYMGLLDYLEGSYASALTRFNTSLSILRKENNGMLVSDILVGTGMALLKTKRPEVAAGYFLEAKRLADDLVIPPVGWRAVYCDGLVKEQAKDAATALARYEDALFRYTGVPEVSINLYGARMITAGDLFESLAAAYVANGDAGKADTVMKKKAGMEKIISLFTVSTPEFTGKEEKAIVRLKDAVGEINYLDRRLADDEYLKGNNTELFTKKLLSAQGKYLTVLDDIKSDAPSLWDTYFRDVYEQ